MTERDQLLQAIAVLEAQRAVLGDAVVDTLIASAREKLASLAAPDAPPAPERAGQRLRRQMTVLFADVVNFTSMAESLDAEDVSDAMNQLWGRLDHIIAAHGGTIDKHIGDGVMALWGTQLIHENDPEQAIKAALAMQAELAAAPGGMQLRIGINTGPVLLGAVGLAGEYTAMGDTVNLASRLERLAPVGGVLIGHDTYRHVRGAFDVEPQAPLAVKGKTELVQTYRVARARPPAFRSTTRGVEGIETRMVGRDRELAQLQALLRGVCTWQRLELVTVVGEAGVGKSRLLHEFTRWADQLPEAILYFKGRATPEMTSTPYALMRSLLAARFAILESDSAPVAREKLARGLEGLLGGAADPLRAHVIGQLIGFDFSASPHLKGLLGDAHTLHERGLRYLHEFFSGVSADQPTLLLLEDIHWADERSLEAISQLVAQAPAVPLLIVALTRPSQAERRLAWLSAGSSQHRIRLEPLSAADSELLVSEILRRVADLPADLRDLIVRRAEGSPFYVEELIKSLIEDGVITVSPDEPWRVAIDRLSAIRIPATLTHILQARLDRLPPGERELLQRASVVGRIFWDRAVEHLRDEAEPAMRDAPAPTTTALEHLCARELIFRRPGSTFSNANEYLFKHAILRDVTYETVLKRTRRAYHAQVAAWLVIQSGERIREHTSQIASHYEQAGEIAAAVDYLYRAGSQSAQISAFQEAELFFRRGLALLEAQDPAARQPAQQIDILLALGELIHRLHRNEAISLLEEALTMARQLSDEARTGRALSWLSRELLELDRAAEADLLFSELRALAEQTADPLTAAHAWRTLGVQAFSKRDFDAYLRCSQRSLALYQEAGDENGVAAALSNIAGALLSLRRYGEAEAMFTRALRSRQDGGNRWGEAHVRYGLGHVAWLQGDYARARRQFEHAVALNREMDDKEGLIRALLEIGLTCRDGGDYAAARAYLGEALAIQQSSGKAFHWQDALFGNLGLTALVQGAYAEAEELFVQALAASKDRLIFPYRGFIADGQGMLAYARGQHAQAAACHREALQRQQALGDGWGAAHAEIQLGFALVELGEYAAARAAFLHVCADPLREQEPPLILLCLAGMAHLYARTGDRIRALELLGLALDHPVTYGYMRERCRRLLHLLEGEIDPAELAAALECGRSLTVAAALADLRAESGQ